MSDHAMCVLKCYYRFFSMVLNILEYFQSGFIQTLILPMDSHMHISESHLIGILCQNMAQK